MNTINNIERNPVTTTFVIEIEMVSNPMTHQTLGFLVKKYELDRPIITDILKTLDSAIDAYAYLRNITDRIKKYGTFKVIEENAKRAVFTITNDNVDFVGRMTNVGFGYGGGGTGK